VTDLDARYGRKQSNGKRNIIVLAAVLLTIFFVWAISVSFFTPDKNKNISAEAVSFIKNEPTRIAATIKVLGDGATGTLHCTGKALDASYAIVGYKEFDVELTGEAEKRIDLAINTTSKAASIVVEACKLQ
jgi:hypothetical protein